MVGGQRIKRLTLLEKLKMSPTSSTTRQAITNSNKYGVTKGNYNAEWIELTEDGRAIVDSASPPSSARSSEFQLSISGVAPFKKLYDEYCNKRLPDRAVMKDVLSEADFEITDLDECVDIFLVNAKDLGLIRDIAGADSLVSIEQALEDSGSNPAKGDPSPSSAPQRDVQYVVQDGQVDWGNT